MKKITFFLPLFFLTSLLSKSQDEKKETIKSNSKKDSCYKIENILADCIVLDFNTKQISSSKKLDCFKRGDYYQFKIKNFNPFLYKVNLQKEDSAIQSSKPPALFDIFSTTGLASLVAGLKEMLPAGTTGAAVGKEVAEFASEKSSHPKKDSIEASEIIKEKSKHIEATFDAIIQLKSNVEKYRFNLEMVAVKAQLLDINSTNNCTNTFDCKYLIEKAEELIGFKDNIVRVSNSDLKDYILKIAPYKNVVDNDKTFKAADAIIIDFYEKKIKSFSIEFDTSYGYNILTKALPQIINIVKSTFEYISLPIQVTEDIATLSIKIEPWKTTEGPAQAYSTKIIFPLKKQTYWGFSSGFYFSPLHNEVFSNKRNDVTGSDTSYNLIKEKSGGIESGVNALLHYGWYLNKDKENIGVQIAIGPGLSLTKNPAARMMLGGGISWGRKDKMMLTTGIIIGQVDRLGEGYKDGITFTSPQKDYTISAIKVHGFLSLTYSFLGSK